MKRIKLQDRVLPFYTIPEEIFHTISHGAGVLLGILVCILCATKAFGRSLPFAGAIIYGTSMIILYCFSAIYHGLQPGMAKKVFQILDHCTIYVLIAGTYTPILLTAFIPKAPVAGWGLMLLQWGVSTVAIILNAIDLHKFRYFSYFSYIVLGWALVFIAPIALSVLSPSAFFYLLLGGISYTIGAILFAFGSKFRWFHSIFHVFVVLGSILQFIAIYCYIL